jgi:endonuclease YncB( thermonuclease family)
MNVIVEVYPGKFNQLTLRLYGINTPELYGDERPMGLESKYKLIEIFTGIPVDVLREMNYSDLRDIFNKDQSYICYVECMDEDDKYGRVLARVYRDHEHRYCVNDMLLSGGYACEMGAHNRRTIRACAAHHAVPEG